MLKRINLVDFLCFRNEVLDFSDKLTILLGRSGGGKTAILEGILFGLFGFSVRSLKMNLDELINENAKSCKVVLEVMLGDKLGVLERVRSQGKTFFSLQIGGRYIEGTLTDKLEKIGEIWGLSKNISKTSLLKAVYISRDSIDLQFPIELEENWVIDLSDRIKEVITKKLREVELKLADIKGRISSLEGVLKNLEERDVLKLIDVEKLRGMRDILRKKLEEVNEQIGSLKEKIGLFLESLKKGVCIVCNRPLKDLSFSVDDLERELNEKMKVRGTLQVDLLTIEKNLEKVSSVVMEEKDKILKDLQTLGEMLVEENKYLDKVKAAQVKVKDLKEVLLNYFLLSFVFPRAEKYSSVLFNDNVRLRYKGGKIEVKIGDEDFKAFTKLSTGEKIRVSMSLKLATSSSLSSLVRIPFLLVDEVFDSLDLENAYRLLNILSQEKSQIILVSHRPIESLLKLSDAVFYYVDRKIKKIY